MHLVFVTVLTSSREAQERFGDSASADTHPYYAIFHHVLDLVLFFRTGSDYSVLRLLTAMERNGSNKEKT